MTLQPRAVRTSSILILAALLLSSCSPTVTESDNESADNSVPSIQDGTNGEIQWIDPNKVQPGPIQHQKLTEAQLARIEALQETFFEVDGQSVDQWVDNFKRDRNPDRELEIWEHMAKTYQGYCSGRAELTLEAKQEVFKVVLLRSMAPPDEVLKRLKLEILSRDEAIEIMDRFGQ